MLLLLLSSNSGADDVFSSPYSNDDMPSLVLWGDTHLHTNMSLDAYSWGGNKRLSPDDAYRFARGEKVLIDDNGSAQLFRPLDFLVIADHIESMGLMNEVDTVQITSMATNDDSSINTFIKNIIERNNKSSDFVLSSDLFLNARINTQNFSGFYKSVWRQVAEKADQFNEPGSFTAFTGYEWTSPGYEWEWDSAKKQTVGNLHRVVIFADDANTVTKRLPFTAYDSTKPEDLWGYFTQYEEASGGKVLAIPHNGNVSNGEMFDLEVGNATDHYLQSRQRWEPLYEVTQIKGDGEASHELSPNDEFSKYEVWDDWYGTSSNGRDESDVWEKKEREYARPALKRGLSLNNKYGINPFKFGMIGSTDGHTSLSASEEDNFWGKWAANYPVAKRMISPLTQKWSLPGWQMSAGGLAAVWAKENTRQSIFSAMQRKEVYATTGTRILVRFFGGWGFEEDDAFRPHLARIGYKKGVPMGGDLTSAPKGKAPSFLIRAIKDADGANLDRVQMIKGWLDVKGELHEKIYNVALSDGREDKGLDTRRVGNTVNVPDASYTNTIGDPELAVVWSDPDFDKDELAFYYLRVLEIPTPRWTAYDAKYFKLKNIPKEVPMVTQERAYTSPIWYTP